MTTAEFVDGKAYLYYDFPNDADPHLYIDEDLTDGKPGKDMGLVFKDPSHVKKGSVPHIDIFLSPERVLLWQGN
jgi:hypothetical protein